VVYQATPSFCIFSQDGFLFFGMNFQLRRI
jgi:hypothetical protein